MNNSDQLFSRDILKTNRDKAASFLAGNSGSHHLFDFGKSDIIERLSSLNRKFEGILELGCRNGKLGDELSKLYPEATIIQTDISGEMLAKRHQHRQAVQLDEENPAFAEGSFDLIVSNLNLHWINNLPKFLSEIYSILQKDGLFIANLIGEKSLYSLRKILFECEKHENNYGMRIMPMLKFETLAGLMQAQGFTMPVVDKDIYHFPEIDLYEFLVELRNIGENNNLKPHRRSYLSKKAFQNIQNYGKIIPEFEILTLTGAK